MRNDLKESRMISLLVTGIFFTALIIPSGGQYAGYSSRVVEMERREASAKPAIPRNPAALMAFPQQFDRYLDDNFGFRSLFVHANSSLRYLLGMPVSSNVVIGKNQWLFLGSTRFMRAHRGIDRLSPDQIQLWVKKIKRYRRRLSARGIGFP